jgi:prepilin-type N-terminal cleavage/methylation domain-containing protein
MTRRHPAFTLIEMLVCISLITLLMAILLPALGRARVAGQMTASASNIRQLHLALHLYAGDFRGSLPCVRFWMPGQEGAPWFNTSFPVGNSWSGKLWHRRYLSDLKVYWSPGRNPGPIDFAGMRVTPQHGHWLYVGYGANAEGAMTEEGKDPNPPLRLDAVRNPRPSWHVLLMEAFRPDAYQLTGIDGYHGAVAPYTHGDRIVRVYMDGHAAIRDGADLGWTYVAPRLGYWKSPNRGRPWYWMNYRHEW